MLTRTLALSLVAAATASADITFFGPAVFPGNATDRSGQKGSIGEGIPADSLGSAGSGITWTGSGQRFLAVSDRGPSTGSTAFQTRFHMIELTIDYDGLPSAAPKCLSTSMFTRASGEPFVGSSKAFDADPAKSARLDPEAIRIGPDGTIYVADEYEPGILAFAPDGKLIKRMAIPDKFLCRKPAADAKDELPPANTTGRQPGMGFEGLAITPKGDKLYAILQAPLLQDAALDASNKRAGVNIRILELALTGNSQGSATPREFLYQLESPANVVSEILAVNDHEFLVIERDAFEGEKAKTKSIFKIDLAAAGDISAVAALPASGAPAGIKPVAKSLFINMLNPKYGLNDDRLPEKIEGLAFGQDLAPCKELPEGAHVLIVSADNDFRNDLPTWFYIFGVGKKDLPGFERWCCRRQGITPLKTA